MLENSAYLVKPGGVLIYYTCSLEPEEGEDQAKQFLKSHGQDFQIKPIERAELGPVTDIILDDGFLRTLPGMTIPGVKGSFDGFFAARFVRNA